MSAVKDRRRKYPWDELLDGTARVVAIEDLPSTVVSFRQSARLAASKRGLQVTVVKHPDEVLADTHLVILAWPEGEEFPV